MCACYNCIRIVRCCNRPLLHDWVDTRDKIACIHPHDIEPLKIAWSE